MTIFKMQRPIVTNDLDRKWRLDTASGRQFFIPEHLVHEKLVRIMGDKFKVFIDMKYRIDDKGVLIIEKVKRTFGRNW